MCAICKRDIAALFRSFTGFLFLALLWFVTALYVVRGNLLGLRAGISASVSVCVMVLLVGAPVLSMRSFSSELKSGTDQLLFTSPVPAAKTVIGKFLALTAVYTMFIASLGVIPFFLKAFGPEPVGADLAAVAGLWLYGLSAMAICIFASSLTNNVMASALIAFSMLAATVFMKALKQTLNGAYAKAADVFDLSSRADVIMSGLLDFAAIAYLLLVTAFFLYMTVISVSRERLKGGVVKRVAAAVIVFAAVSALIHAIPQDKRSFDVSASGVYSLTDTTVSFVKGIDSDVTIYVMADAGTEDKTVRDTIDRIAVLNERIAVEHIDPALRESFLSGHHEDAEGVMENSLLVRSGERARVVRYESMYQIGEGTGGEYFITGYDAEGQIVSALSYVTSAAMPKICMLKGHEEEDADAAFKDVLARLNVEAEDLKLLQAKKVPDDADAVFINCPRNDITDEDLSKLLAYTDAGGRILMVTNPAGGQTGENLTALLKHFSVSVSPGIIAEEDASRYYNNPAYLLPVVSETSLAAAKVGAYGADVFSPYAQAITYSEGEGVTFTEILSSSDKAFLITDLNASSFERPEGTGQGRYIAGLRAYRTEGGDPSTLVLFTSPQIFTEAADNIVSGGNRRLFEGVVSMLVNAADTVSVPVKSYGTQYLTVDKRTASAAAIVMLVVIPAALILAGAYVSVRRRHG